MRSLLYTALILLTILTIAALSGLAEQDNPGNTFESDDDGDEPGDMPAAA